MTNSVTILRARSRRLAKLVHPDGRVEGYDQARTFDLAERPVPDLAALADLLRGLLPRWDMAVVRGAIADPQRVRGVRRLLHPDAKMREPATLRDVPRRWLALDMEGIPLPADVPAADLHACYHIALATLPEAFQGCACIVQASGSHGIKPDLRLRLWFWCDRPVGGAELKRWLRHTPADPSLFGAAQPIYTAAPVMAGGAIDPLATRIAVISGRALLTAGAIPPHPPPRTPAPGEIHALAGSHRAEHLSGRYAHAALIRAATNIATADKRHPCIIRECTGLARLVHAGLLAESAMRAVVTEAARRAGKEDGSEISSCIAWALAHPSTGKLPEARRG